MIVDNFELIRSLLRFEDKDDFYFCQIIQRKKDGNDVPSANNGYRMVRPYYITSIEDFDKRVPAIIQYCEQNNARAYFNLNVRNANEVALTCAQELIGLSKEGRANQCFNMLSHTCGITPKRGIDKLWVVDVDTHDQDILWVIDKAIERCRSGNKIGNDEHGDIYDNIVAKIPTLNGIHFITHGFDVSQLKNKISYNSLLYDVKIQDEIVEEVCKSIKKDNPTLLYFNKKEE